MLLQTHLYYSCSTLLQLVYAGDTEILLYGVEKICRMCEEWKRYFAPDMLSNLGASLNKKQRQSWCEVMEAADCLSILQARGQEVLARKRSRDEGGARRRFSEFLFVTKDIVLPVLRHLCYDAPGNAHVVMFDKTERFLTSFVPVETSLTPSSVPGVFNEDEREIVSIYMDALKYAPSIAQASGVETGDEPRYIWAEGDLLKRVYGHTALERKMLDEECDERELYTDIYESWKKEFGGCRESKAE